VERQSSTSCHPAQETDFILGFIQGLCYQHFSVMENELAEVREADTEFSQFCWGFSTWPLASRQDPAKMQNYTLLLAALQPDSANSQTEERLPFDAGSGTQAASGQQRAACAACMQQVQHIYHALSVLQVALSLEI